MNDADFRELQLEAQRRPLRADEETALRAYLAACPKARADWEVDFALNQVLRHLPDAPLSSNFTARLLQTLEQEERHRLRQPAWARWLRAGPWRWPARAALVGVVVLTSFGWYGHYQSVTRARLAESVETVYGMASLPSDVLQNVDAISQAPPDVDVKLLAALQ